MHLDEEKALKIKQVIQAQPLKPTKKVQTRLIGPYQSHHLIPRPRSKEHPINDFLSLVLLIRQLIHPQLNVGQKQKAYSY